MTSSNRGLVEVPVPQFTCYNEKYLFNPLSVRPVFGFELGTLRITLERDV
jgi:hypothetical protein